MGVKKSTVCTSAWLAEILYTPASSALSKPTRTFGSFCRANFPSTASSAAGLSLLAQPAALTCSVSRIAFASGIVCILKHRGQAVGHWQIAIGKIYLPLIFTDGTDHQTSYHGRIPILRINSFFRESV